MTRCCLLLPLLVLAACTPDSPPDGTADPDSLSVIADRPMAPLRAVDLAAACEGRPVDRAAPYAAADTLHRAAILIRDSTDAPYRLRTYASFLPDEWLVTSTADLPQAQVVLCVTRFPGAFARTCEFFPPGVDGKPDEGATPSLLAMHDASYAVSVRILETGEERLDLGLDAPVRVCPLMHQFPPDGREDRGYALPPFRDLRDALVPVLEPGFDPYRDFDPEVRDQLRRTR